MRAPNSSPVLNKNRAHMSPEIISSTGAGVWRKFQTPFSVLDKFQSAISGKFRRRWKILPRFSGSTKCYPCQGSGTFLQGKRLLEIDPAFRKAPGFVSSETATTFLSLSDEKQGSETRVPVPGPP